MLWAISWALYGVGHAIYVVSDQWLGDCLGERIGGMCYGAYSTVMRASVACQGDRKGPWRTAP